MSDGEVHARYYATGQPVRAKWSAGQIVSLAETNFPPAEDIWLAPPLLDLQINGYAGVDFQQDGLELPALLQAVRRLRADGCARFLLTLVTDEWPRLMARLRHFCELRSKSPELQGAILGWHIEGPFLSAEPGFCGAHDPAAMLDPKPEHIHELNRIVGSTPLLITMAPERAGASQAIQMAKRLGITVSLGHTNASRQHLLQAMASGAVAFTHLGNACPQALDRHDNILWRVLDEPPPWISLIADGIHVAPSLFRLIHRLQGERIYYTTDAMSAAGAPPGRYRLGKTELEVGEDRIVRQPGKTNFAGSALRPIDGVFTAARILNCSWQETWRRFSETPGRVIGWQNSLEVGRTADFCVLKFGDEKPDNFELRTFVAGVSS